jgi:hypothetical protein
MSHFNCSKSYNNSEIYIPNDSICLNNYPIISIATLYNYFEKKSGPCCEITTASSGDYCNKNHIVLNVIHLEEKEFFNLFYHNSSKYFCVNKSLITNNNIIFSEQTFISNNSKNNHFSLYSELLKCFEENCSISVNNINPASLISLQKEVYKTQSLASVCGTQIGLTWDQVINSLISNGYIQHSCRNNCAPIIFQVNFTFYSCALNIHLTITFQYKVHIYGYSLKHNSCDSTSSSDSSSSGCDSSSSGCDSSSSGCDSSSSGCDSSSSGCGSCNNCCHEDCNDTSSSSSSTSGC